MDIKQFGEELKQARIEKKISLTDISAETRINIKFLEAIESGQFHNLPQTYVRAFLREYALMLSLEPSDILQQYKSAQQEIPARKTDETASQSLTIQNKILAGSFDDQMFSLTPFKRNIVFGILIVAAIALVIVLANSNKNSDSGKSVTEVPFDRVVRESEAASISQSAAAVDTVPFIAAPQNDSLRLEITTLDSVWISILIDSKKGEEYLFGANRKRIWAAKERFVVSLGNAGGATFSLNGKEIGALGRHGAVVRNAVITEAILKK